MAGYGLYDFHARFYDPYVGRFLSADSLVPNPAGGQSFNRYSYSYNNPLGYRDPSGHSPSPVIPPNWFSGLTNMRIDISNQWQVVKTLAVAGCWLTGSCHVDEGRTTISGATQAELLQNGMPGPTPLGMVSGPLGKAGQRLTDEALEGVGEQASRALARGGLDLTEQSVQDKLARYLLNESHPDGGSKAQWFRQALGFVQDNLDALAQQIKFDPVTAIQTGVTEYGVKYNQTIAITGANGKVIDVVFAWIRSAEDDVIRLVTAIPTKQ